MKKLSIESLVNLIFILNSGFLIAQVQFLERRPYETPNFEQYPSSACVDHHHPYTNVVDNLFLRFDGYEFNKSNPLFWEHEGNRAVRIGDWKLVSEFPGPWELYNISEDRSETNNLINKEKGIANNLQKKYEDWAQRCGILDWPIRVDNESTKKIYSMNKNEVGLDPNITPMEIEEERRYKKS